MKNIMSNNLKITFILSFILIAFTSCDRDLTEDAVDATFSTEGDIFIDEPIGLGPIFYFPFGDSKFTALSFTDSEGYESTSSIRIDVPNADDPEGSYAGAIIRAPSPRDLSGFDALTFWAKGSEARTINDIGFGQDFFENKYEVELQGALQLTTNWQKYVIPIPDPSKLTQERGMFWYAEGPNLDGTGWTFWIDELKFENLGTLAQAQPRILGGLDIEQQAFINVPVELSGLTQTFNGPSGQNITVNAAPAYFNFESSEPSVATVDNNGVVSIIGVGTTTITASMAGVQAQGSLTLNTAGEFDFAPTPPTRDSNDVISIFSDAYDDVAVDYYNGFFLDGFQTTLGGSPPLNINGDAIINYTVLNFVGIGTFETVAPVNVSQMTHLHIDIKPNEAIEPGDFMNIQLINDVGGNETSGTVPFDSSNFIQDEWTSLDIPISDFGMGDVTQIGLLFFISDTTISDIFVDNIYYYRE